MAVVTSVAAAELSVAAERARLAEEASATGDGAATRSLVRETIGADGDSEPPDSTDQAPSPTVGVLAVDRALGLALVAAPPGVAPFERSSAQTLPSGSYVGFLTLDASGCRPSRRGSWCQPGALSKALPAGPKVTW